MTKPLLKRFPNEMSTYRGVYMFHMDNDLEIVKRTFTSCRETFNACLRHKYNETERVFSSINTHRLHVLITLGASNKENSEEDWAALLEKMTKSLKLLNSFERSYKWPLSRIKLIDNVRKNTYVPSVLFVGNRKWITSPYLVSTYTLLIRIGTAPWFTNDLADESDHNKLITKIKKECLVETNRDGLHIKHSIKTINILMANYKELFSNKSRKYHWSTAIIRPGRNPYNEGIRVLASGTTGNIELLNKCNEISKRK